MTDYISYMPMPDGMMQPPMMMDNSMMNSGVSQIALPNTMCMCAECELQRWEGNPLPPSSMLPLMPPAGMPMVPQPMMTMPQPSGFSQPAQPRKYRHNPYAPVTVGPHQPSPQTASSVPPMVTPGDALANVVPNVSEFDLYANNNNNNNNNMAYQMVAKQQQAPVLTSGYTLQEQFAGAVGMITELATSPRGRSMLQAVIRLRQPDKIATIYNEFSASNEIITHLMLDGNACHVVRALLEVIDAVDAAVLVAPSIMTPSLVIQLATTSQHTRRILQTLYERFSTSSFCEEITMILGTHAQYLAATQQGCIALMRIADNAIQSQRNHIHEMLFPAMAQLATDPYGNYVVQHMIECGDSYLVSEAVLTHFLPSYVALCCNKFASNVMEKVFYSITPAARRTLLDSVLYDTNALHALMHDSFGNFVIQSAIESCNNLPEFRRIADRMRPLIHTSPYGHKIEAKLKTKRMSRNSGIAHLNTSNLSSSAASSVYNTVPSTPTSLSNDTSVLPDMIYCEY